MSSRSWMSLAAVAAVLVSLFALPATSALAKPGKGSGQACTYSGGSSQFIRMCFYIEGTGNHVEHMQAWDLNHEGLALDQRYHIEIVGPAGHIANCDEFPVPWPDLTNSPVCKVEYHTDVTAGRYCQKTWEYSTQQPAGWFSLATPACIDVHA